MDFMTDPSGTLLLSLVVFSTLIVMGLMSSNQPNHQVDFEVSVLYGCLFGLTFGEVVGGIVFDLYFLFFRFSIYLTNSE